MTVLWVLIGLLVGAAGAVLAYRQREEQVGTLRDQLSGQAVQLTEAAVRQATLAEKLAARDEALARQKEELTALQEREKAGLQKHLRQSSGTFMLIQEHCIVQ